MKTNTLKAAAAVGLSALLIGSAAAQDESVSKPVGYETLNYNSGFNYFGIRLHEAQVTSGASVGADGTTITVGDGVVDALVDGESYIFEALSGDAAGAVSSIVSYDAAADTIVLSDDISGDFEDGSEFAIRPSSSLETVFGVGADVSLASAAAPGQADQVWVPDGSGGFVKYYLYSFFGAFEWRSVATDSVVDPADIDLFYTDGIILQAVNPGSFVVSGSVKVTDTNIVVEDGFNYLSSVYPAGSNLLNFYGPIGDSGLSVAAAPGQADQVWIPSDTGFTKYYPYSFFGTAEWRNVDGDAAAPALADMEPGSGVEMTSGFIFQNVGGMSSTGGRIPSFYSTL